jgi:outer membrane protein OmpA-like peptidoglycan-associated protein
LFVEGGAGGTLTGDLVRAEFEAGVGYGFALASYSLAPTLRYLQVFQPNDPLSAADAHVLMLGAEFALLDAKPPAVIKKVAAPAPKDTDGDGLLDRDDTCTTEAEDHDGFEDQDGCPEIDNDHDKILDAKDKCPNDAEDVDGYEDEDGCPDPDNDRDTILDADDQCPFDAEVINGNADYDGCPDEGLIAMIKDRIVLEEQVLFDFEKARVRSAAHPVLDAIVSLCKLHPEWTSMRIEGHADSRGDEAFNQELSKRRAEMVRKELVKRGIPEGIIESVGFGSTKPRDRRATEGAYRLNRRVEFVVVSSSTGIAAAPGSGAAAADQTAAEGQPTASHEPAPTEPAKPPESVPPEKATPP